MTKKVLTIAILSALFLSACSETSSQENTDEVKESVEKPMDDITTTTYTNQDGETLDLKFNNTNGTVTLNFDGKTVELASEKPASGIWYKNENFELRGKGNDIQLKKDGKVVFTHEDDIVKTSLKNEEGQTLDMTFNNTEGTAKVYLNGGEQIDLVAQKAASGIWYKNEHYELRGKGDNLELTKDGKTVFKNQD